MRKVIVNIALSLDGYIAGPNGEYDWLYADQDYGMTGFFSRIDTALMGRKSYEVMVEVEPQLYAGLTNYVFSKTLNQPDTENIMFIKGQAEDFVKALKAEAGKDIWLVGGGELAHFFLKHYLVDEMMLAVHPILLGNGIPLFKKLDHRIDFDFIKSINYSSGLVQLIYKKNVLNPDHFLLSID